MDPYAHLTPKPLDEQVPGAWNFVEPNPLNIDGSVRAGQITIAEPMDMRIKLSPMARSHLLRVLERVLDGSRPEAMLGAEYIDDPEDPEWRMIEDALTEIFMPPTRWIAGVAPSDPSGRPGHSQLVAGGH